MACQRSKIISTTKEKGREQRRKVGSEAGALWKRKGFPLQTLNFWGGSNDRSRETPTNPKNQAQTFNFGCGGNDGSRKTSTTPRIRHKHSISGVVVVAGARQCPPPTKIEHEHSVLEVVVVGAGRWPLLS